MAEHVQINEVGPRDGLQNQPRCLGVEERLRLIGALVDAGVRAIEAGSFVSPKAVPQMADTDRVWAGLPATDRVHYSVLIPNHKGYELARAAGAGTVALVISATDTMNEKNIRMNTARTMAVAEEVITLAREDGVRTKAYIAVAFACPFEGKVAEAEVMALAQRLFAAGVEEVVIADTIGAADPRAVQSLLGRLVATYGADRLACHFHDTRAMALANVYAALEQGIRTFDSSVGGLGGCPFADGAAGNVASQDVVMMLHQMGYDTGIDLGRLVAASHLAAELTGDESLGGRARAWLEQHLASAASA